MLEILKSIFEISMWAFATVGVYATIHAAFGG